MIFDSTADASRSLNAQYICKQLDCLAESSFFYAGIVAPQKKIVLKRGCSTCGQLLLTTHDISNDMSMYDIARIMLLSAKSQESLINDCVCLFLDIAKSKIPFKSFDMVTDYPVIGVAAPIWLDLSSVNKVTRAEVNQVSVEHQELGLIFKLNNLSLGFLKEINANLLFSAAGVLSIVDQRNSNANFSKHSETFKPMDVSLFTIQQYLNKAYFSPHNPIHEIQWIVANLLADLPPLCEDREFDALIRLAVYFIWEYREGTTDVRLAICKAHGDAISKPTLTPLQ